MRIEQLEYLIMLKEKKSLNEAAKNLYISHQALGKSIKSLESELGVDILDRSSKSCVFTPEGEVILESAKRLLKEYHRLLNKLKQIEICQKNILIGELYIYSSMIFSMSILPDIIDNFRQEVPNVRVLHKNCGVKNFLRGINQISPKNNFIGLVSFPVEDYDAISENVKKLGCILNILRESKLEFFCSKKSKFANMKNVSVNMLLNEPMIRFSDVSNVHTFDIHSHNSQDITTTSYEVFLNSIIENKGIGRLCDIAGMRNSLFYHDIDMIAKIDVEDEIIHYLGYITCDAPSEIVKIFAKYLDEYIVK